MAGHCMMARVCAVLCYALCWFNLDNAVLLFDGTWNKVMKEKVTHVKDFINDNMYKFVTTGSVHDLPRTGRPHKIDDDLAKQCAVAFKAGYADDEVIDQDQHIQGSIHHFYSCMWEAEADCELIRNTIRVKEVSAQHLLRRMEEVDPHLRKIKLDYKLELNEHQKMSRKSAAATLLQKHKDDNTFLDRIIWADEWHCWCTPQHADIKVWCDAHDARARVVLPIPQLKKGQKPLVIRCIAFVNAKLGPIHIEFTTGTDDLQRELVDRLEPYLVSWNHTLSCRSARTTPCTFNLASHAARYFSCPSP